MEYFSAATTLRLKELPHLAFGRGADKTIRYFPDKLPIGVTGRRSHRTCSCTSSTGRRLSTSVPSYTVTPSC